MHFECNNSFLHLNQESCSWHKLVVHWAVKSLNPLLKETHNDSVIKTYLQHEIKWFLPDLKSRQKGCNFRLLLHLKPIINYPITFSYFSQDKFPSSCKQFGFADRGSSSLSLLEKSMMMIVTHAWLTPESGLLSLLFLDFKIKTEVVDLSFHTSLSQTDTRDLLALSSYKPRSPTKYDMKQTRLSFLYPTQIPGKGGN